MYLHKRRVIDRRIQKTSGVNEEDVAEQMRAGTKERCSFLLRRKSSRADAILHARASTSCCRWCASTTEIYWGPLPRRSATVSATNRKKNPEVLLFVNVASFTAKYDFRANNHRSLPHCFNNNSVVRKRIKYCFKVRPGLSITSTEIILADLTPRRVLRCRRFSNDNRYAR